MPRLARPSQELPLFTWPEQVEITALAERRAEIVARMEKLPRYSHRRVVLAARLRELTERQLRLEGQIAAKTTGQG